MTEAEWLTNTDPRAMLHFVRTKKGVTDRKLRLFACACCRRIWHLLTDERSRKAVELAERYADGLATKDEIRAVYELSLRAAYDAADTAYAATRKPDSSPYFDARAAHYTTGDIDFVFMETDSKAAWSAESATQAGLLRCVAGNPFRPLPRLDAAWLTPRVLSLTNGIYDRGAFDHLPELAYLLADAGCDNDEVLEHLRGPGPHARGCHGLDAILGRS
jgi:hypothetical protein